MSPFKVTLRIKTKPSRVFDYLPWTLALRHAVALSAASLSAVSEDQLLWCSQQRPSSVIIALARDCVWHET